MKTSQSNTQTQTIGSKSPAKKRILLAIQSQYSGHLSRGLVYYRLLKDKYDLKVITVGGPPASWFGPALGIDFKSYPGLYMVENKHGGISQFGTAGMYLRNTGEFKRVRQEIREFLTDWQPDLVVSDFEPTVSSVCIEMDVPVLTVDAHRRIYLKDCPRPKIGLRRAWDYFCMKVGISFMLRWGHRSLAISFFDWQSDDIGRENTIVCPPILRPEVLAQPASDGDYLLIYHNNGGEKSIILDECKDFPTKVYGYGTEYEKIGNIEFKPMSGPEFIKDLAGCRAYASRAGFESVAEALYYQKPIFLVPQSGQFEQSFNADHARRLGALVADKDFDYQKAYQNLKPTEIDRQWVESAHGIFLAHVEDMTGQISGRNINK